MKHPRFTIVALVVLLVFSLGGCVQAKDSDEKSAPEQPITPSSYEELYDYLNQIKSSQETAKSRMRDRADFVTDALEAAPQSSDLATKSGESSSSNEYSQTNTQVAGIDEADIVKTDGEFIYFVSGSEIVIARAAGSDTAEVSRISIVELIPKVEGTESHTVSLSNLYIQDNTLVVLYQYSLLTNSATAGSFAYSNYYRNAITEAAFYDVSNAEQPRFIKRMGQSGSYSTSRLHEGNLYIISTYAMYDSSTFARNNPETFVPHVLSDGVQETIAVSDVCLVPETKALTFTITSSLNISNAERVDTQSILGANSTIYMSAKNLYLGGSEYKEEEINSYQDGSFKVTEYLGETSTRLTRLGLDAGALKLGATSRVEGSLLNQFSLDEYEENLRLVTSVDKSMYRTLEDSKGVITDHSVTDTAPSTNALYVLNQDLVVVGSIEGLAEDERVYSVRFEGPIGYFVTFRETDPLFAVDLSNPKKPEIRSELKIPGFSSYLHVYTEGRLLGLGMAADERGVTSGLKLSMFDTTDPYAVTEKHTLDLGYAYSEALYDHHAAFINQGKNIIGFPVGSGYVIYGYSDEEGFSLRKEIDESPTYSYSTTRGLFVGDYLYICTASNIGVYKLDTLEEVKQIPIEVRGGGYHDIMPLMVE